ncbi:MAG: flagellar basal body P-ring protein FlgI [Pirellulales bacterium]|nr:flagellar basal body P-ring protein FlgI [Pirellulales bacterium]
MKSHRIHLLLVPAIIFTSWAFTAPAPAQTVLKSICRVKGQEENTLQGLGIVVGLKGTGDGGDFLPTINSLAKIMTVMGEPPSSGGLAELKDAKNVALVAVTATVPAAGARQGDKIDCMVSSIGPAKDLTGGRLFLTPLVGPDRHDPTVYAFADGLLSIEDSTVPTTGRVHAGCRLEADFFNPFVKDGRITLVLDANHADFEVAQSVAEEINKSLGFGTGSQDLAKAIDQCNIIVAIPSEYRESHVMFVSMVLGTPIREPQPGARVVINERTGSIVISGEVEIGAVVVTHKNIVIETGAPAGGGFVPLDPGQTSKPKLDALVKALNAVHVSTGDIVDIIKGLDRNGKLHAQLIFE